MLPSAPLESGNYFLTGLMALGMAWAFIRADPQAATSRALAVALAMTGVSMFSHITTVMLIARGPLPWWGGIFVLPEVVAFCAGFEWTYRVRRTIPAGELRTVFGDNAIRAAQGLIVFYALAVAFHPNLWATEFLGSLHSFREWSSIAIIFFAVPIDIALGLWALSMLLCLRRRPDPAEQVRIVAVLLASPLIALGIVLPAQIAPTTTTLGLVVVLAGAMRHAQLHGRRGLFLSRFLSPQVATLVNRDGLNAAMREDCHMLSVVCCDLRGFTAYAGADSSERVLQLLREYYDAVGHAVAEVGGTIKDYAGDGALILVGAPVAMPDHAPRAVELGERIRTAVLALTQRWSRPNYPLGIGVGIASGLVTVGVIGGEGRLEYAAVGQAVNLASRLCDQAESGEILIDQTTVAMLDPATPSVLPHVALTLKGFSEPVLSFSLA